jgi:hypothetical protein
VSDTEALHHASRISEHGWRTVLHVSVMPPAVTEPCPNHSTVCTIAARREGRVRVPVQFIYCGYTFTFTPNYPAHLPLTLNHVND